MTKSDPEAVRRHLAERYASLTEEELRLLARALRLQAANTNSHAVRCVTRWMSRTEWSEDGFRI